LPLTASASTPLLGHHYTLRHKPLAIGQSGRQAAAPLDHWLIWMARQATRLGRHHFFATGPRSKPFPNSRWTTSWKGQQHLARPMGPRGLQGQSGQRGPLWASWTKGSTGQLRGKCLVYLQFMPIMSFFQNWLNSEQNLTDD
jgi:hypothetical protein